jgi:GNAT superfamily N-acetyltransferase
MSVPTLRVRPGVPADIGWALALAAEMARFGLPPWRDHDVFVEQCRTSLRSSLAGDDPRDVVLIAVDARDEPLGLVHLVVRPDANTGRDAVHLDEVVVEPDHQGGGVGSFLVAEAEQWAGDRGAIAMVLAVFQGNTAGRRFYARHGFGDDIVRLVKQLPDARSDHPHAGPSVR